MTWSRRVLPRARIIGVFAAAVGCLSLSLTSSAAASRLPQPRASNQLKGVACVSGRNCWAVGSGGEILHWNGSSWTVSSSPVGTGDLSKVACGSPNSCWALGSPLLHWNGVRWNTRNLSLPARTLLSAVTCSSASNCLIVGTYGRLAHTLALRWNGTKWTRVDTPDPAKGAQLTAVTCVSRVDCWAVGTYAKRGDAFVFGIQWNGSRWRQRWTSKAFLPATILFVSVNDVDCTSATNCWAAGTDAVTPDGSSALFLHWSASRLTVSVPSLGAVQSIDCSSSSNCFAVGSSGNGLGAPADAIFRWNGKHWHTVTLPATGSGAGTELWGVSCTASRACWAVGDDNFLGSNLALRWDGAHWTSF